MNKIKSLLDYAKAVPISKCMIREWYMNEQGDGFVTFDWKQANELHAMDEANKRGEPGERIIFTCLLSWRDAVKYMRENPGEKPTAIPKGWCDVQDLQDAADRLNR
jgi:hypothetical protein